MTSNAITPIYTDGPGFPTDIRAENPAALKKIVWNLQNDGFVKKYGDTRPFVSYDKEFTPARMARRIAVVTVVVLVIFGLIAVFALAFSGHLLTFPQDFLNMFHHINYSALAIAASVIIPLFAGAFLVMHHAATKKEPLLRTPQFSSTRGAICNITGQQLEYAFIHQPEKRIEKAVYIDRSTLEGMQKGETRKAFLYEATDIDNHYAISTMVAFLGVLPYTIGAIAYNVLRACVIPFYIFVQFLREKCGRQILYPKETLKANEYVKILTDESGKVIVEKESHLPPPFRHYLENLKDDTPLDLKSVPLELREHLHYLRGFHITDIFVEVVKSIWRAVKAPFYGLAYFMAALYSFVNPMGGKKSMDGVERDWNGGVTLVEGMWMIPGWCPGKQTLWKWEGGGGPLSLGRNGFYMAGCRQPVGIVEVYFDGNVLHTKKTYYMATAIKPEKNIYYEIRTLQEIKLMAEKASEIESFLENEGSGIQVS